jgi:DNA-binding NarL/FixJ family response regulator
MRPYQIILADDHVMFRQGIKKIIDEAGNLQVMGEAGNGAELMELLGKKVPDMIILDISMPQSPGLDAAKEIKTRYPQVKILILTMHKSNEYLNHSLAAGADGYLLKEDADTELFSAIDTIRQHGTYISPLLSTQLKELLIQKFRGDRLSPAADPLSKREKEVLTLIAEGKSSKEIGQQLLISARTAEHHRANIMRKLNCRKTAELVKYAIRKGYVANNPYTVY